ncbi:MAG: hypothetical protein A2Y33_01010 [Spirochaetes bacterium GWF1_51_8]|nr:MAG: hypothetical protein A2Y33_01010 [Spirochaetes bacterium GWF1_51_8]
MKELKKKGTIMGVFFLFAVMVLSCGSSGAAVQPQNYGGGNSGSQQVIDDELVFQSTGVAPEWNDAKNMAYTEIVKKAVAYLGYDVNNADIKGNFLTWQKASKYINGKWKKWVSSSRNEAGEMVLQFEAPIFVKKLNDDIKSMGIGKPAVTPQKDPEIAPVNPQKDPDVKDNGNVTAQDFNDVDISSLTFLVTYNEKQFEGLDPDFESYAQWGVTMINKELAAANIQVFDVETMEQLKEEKNLLQEANSGSLDIGMLLANEVFAELYAQITPDVNYQGKKAHVMLTVKVFARTTGKLVATIEKGGLEYELNNKTVSIKASMKDAVAKVMKELVPALKKYIGGGRFYYVSIQGLASSKEAISFSSAVKKVSGVINVTMKSGSKSAGTFDFYVQFKGNPTDLLEALFTDLGSQPGFEDFDLLEMRGNELMFTLQ